MKSNLTESDDRPEGESSDWVAVIGMRGRFPGAQDVDELWEQVRDGRELISFFSDEELLEAGVNESTLKDPNYVKARGVVKGIKMFDAGFFGYSPREAAYTDPQQRLFLECAWELFEHSGYDITCHPGRVGVFAGTAASSYLLNNLWQNGTVAESVPPDQLLLANDKDQLTTRVAYHFNLKGPCVTVQTACSTSLVALHMACQSLLNGECDMALAGGVALSIPQTRGHLFREGGKNSPDGHSRTFDDRAQGTVQSEGAAMVLLKRFDDALREDDAILAVVRGSAINNDGAGKVSYTAPSVDGQAEVVRSAQLLANVSPESIQYVECHGTATPMGDPIEVAALTKAFRGGTAKEEFCAIGSLKTNVGHMDVAAGMAGFIKTVLSLHHRCIPPSLHFEAPNKNIPFAGSPFFVNTQLRQWSTQGQPRRAGVSSFGVGGTNAHVILEEAPARQVPAEDREAWQLLLLSARNETALNHQTANLLRHLRDHPEQRLSDVAYTLQVGRKLFKHRRAIVCRRDDAMSTLRELPPHRVFGSVAEHERPVVFLLPGQGPQYPGMGSELYEREPVFRDAVDRCSKLLEPYLVNPLVSEFTPSNATSAPENAPSRTPSQAALFAHEYSLAQLWLAWGVRPRALIGHSMGEYVAATLAGVLELGDALRLIVLREQLIRSLPEGGIVTVLLNSDAPLPDLGEDVTVSAFNAPGVYSLSGSLAGIEAAQRALRDRRIVHSRLPVSHVSHCELVEPILGAFRQVVAQVKLSPPEIPCISNVTGEWLTTEQATDPDYWVRHLRQPVQFTRGVDAVLDGSESILLEVGPGRTLASLIYQHARGDQQVVIASQPEDPTTLGESEAILRALGKVWAAGGHVARQALHEGARRLRVPLPTYPFERQRCWIEPDRRATPEFVSEPPEEQESDEAFTAKPNPTSNAPLNGAQKAIMKMWQDLLGTAQVSVHDDFFELGGNSLLGIQLHTKIKEHFEVDLPLKSLLTQATVAGMAEVVQLTVLEEIEALELQRKRS